MGYSKSAISGFSWQTILKGATYVLVAIKMFFLARILSPEIFGVFSIVTIALGVTEAATQTGVNLTIVRSKHSVKYFLDSAWVIAIIRGIVIGIIMMLLGFALSNFYDRPELLILIFWISFVPVIKGFINPSIITLQKNLRFFEDSLYRFHIVASEAIFAILLGLLTRSIYALIFSLILSALVEVIVSFVFFKDRPTFVYRKSRGAEILKGAKLLSFSAFFDYLNENLDNFLIGRINGVYNLGLYHYAYSLSHKLNHDLAKSMTHGTLPIFSRVRNEKQRLLRAFYKSLGVTLGLSIVASLPLLLFPEFLINLIFGKEWLEVVSFIHWLILAGIIQSISAVFYSLFMARKEYLQVNIHLVFSVVSMAVLVWWLGGLQGITGAAFAIFLSRVISLPALGLGFFKIKNSKSK